MKRQTGVAFLVLAALVALGTAVAHLSCIYLGPECYATQMAPPQTIESSINGTYLAPIGTIIASGIFIILGLYALSGAGFTGKLIDTLPLVHYAIYTIAVLCIIRGLLPLQLWLRHPEKVTYIVFYAGIVWLMTGILYLVGYRICSTEPTST